MTRPPPQGFVELAPAIPHLKLAIGYATPLNFCGCVLPGYAAPGAWLRQEAVESLVAAAGELERHGCGLLCFDAYRPQRASRFMTLWAERSGRQDLLKGYVSPTSRHNRGTSIDVGLFRLDTGGPVDMGTAWDDFSALSHDDGAVSPEARASRIMLREALVSRGWQPYHREWWHFEFPLPDAAPRDVPYGPGEPDEGSWEPARPV